MPSPRRSSDADVDPEDPYSGQTSWRPVDRTGTQPLDDPTAPQGSGVPIDSTDFATRRGQRRQRQSNARVNPQRFSQMAQRVDNRQIFIIGGILIVLLVALLVWRAVRPSDGTPATGIPGTTQETDPNATPGPSFIQQTPGTEATSIAPIEIATAPAATASSGASLVVTGTGSEGLFLRADPNTNGAPVTTLPEGTKLEDLGEQQNDGTYTWKKVRAPSGQEGWVAANYVVTAP